MASKYLYIQGLPGESRSYPLAGGGKNDGLIEIDSLNFGVHIETTPGGSALVGGTAKLSTLSIRKEMDKSTPALFFKLCAGEVIAEMTFVMLRTGAAGSSSLALPKLTGVKNPLPPNPVMSPGVYVYNLIVCQDVLVTNYHTDGNLGPGNRPMETLSFSVGKLMEGYNDINNAGMKVQDITTGHDYLANKKLF